MLQYAAPNAGQSFSQPPVFGEPDQRRQSSSSNGYSIPRPPSTTSQHSNHHDQYQHRNSCISSSGNQPALSTLAQLAASAPAAVTNNALSTSGNSTRSSTPASHANMSSQPVPSATPGGQGQNGPPVCANCSTSTTPLWRRDESGSVLCNACGLFLKLHGRPRPISLKTDVIKSRNRVKTAGAKKRDSNGGQDGLLHAPNGYPAAHPDAAQGGFNNAHSHSMPMGMNGEQSQRPRSPNGNNNNNNNNNNNIFDTVSLPSDTFASPSFSAFSMRQPSPAPHLLNGSSSNQMDPPQNYDSIINQNNTLRTRVSELEVINDLFRGRVAELEACEQEARRNVHTKEDEILRLNAGLHAANARTAELEMRLRELEEEGPTRKKARTEGDSETGASTPGM